MKLNLDCVRQILLCVEENTGLRKFCHFIDSGLEKSQTIIGEPPIPPPDYQGKLLKNFDNDELIYHINYCVGAELLCTNAPLGLYQIVITDLTPKGHDFLENIRNDKVWSKVKDAAAEIGVKSVETARQIATDVVAQLISNYFA